MVGYFYAGIALFRQYVTCKKWSLGVLTLDLVFKFFIVCYMFFFAIPLQRLTGNENILLAYFTPDESIYSSFSLLVTGLQLRTATGGLYAILYGVLVISLIYYFIRPEFPYLCRGEAGVDRNAG